MVVEFLDVDRGSVFQFLPDMEHLKRVHAWTAEGALSSPEQYAIEELPWSIEKIKMKELAFAEEVKCPDIGCTGCNIFSGIMPC